MLVEPDSLTIEVVADALLRMGMSFTESGSFEDPNEPEDPESRAAFSAVSNPSPAPTPKRRSPSWSPRCDGYA